MDPEERAIQDELYDWIDFENMFGLVRDYFDGPRKRNQLRKPDEDSGPR